MGLGGGAIPHMAFLFYISAYRFSQDVSKHFTGLVFIVWTVNACSQEELPFTHQVQTNLHFCDWTSGFYASLLSEYVWEREDCMCMRAGFDEGVYIVRFNLFSPYILHKKMLIFFKIEHMICDEQR